MTTRKRLRQILFLVTTLMIMVSSMRLSAYADTPAQIVPSASDRTTITVHGVESDATVTAYQIVKPVYNTATGAWNGYEVVKITNGSTICNIVDIENPTEEEMAKFTQNIRSFTGEKVELTASGDDYTNTAMKPGLYLILVSKTGASKIYNPMIVGLGYSDNASDDTGLADLDAGSVNANHYFVFKGAEVYAKSSTPGIEKVIASDTNENYGSAGRKYDDVQIGDTIHYTITASIPAYSDAFVNPYYYITDDLTDGLTFSTKPVVKVGDTELTEGTDYTCNTSIIGSQSMYIMFNPSYLTGLLSTVKVTVTYSAVLDSKAAVNFASNVNTVKLIYSHNPDQKGSSDGKPGKPTDPTNPDSPTDPTNPVTPGSSDEPSPDEEDVKKTYTYTFGIDASLNGDLVATEEIFKTGHSSNLGSPDDTRLAGAEFTLYQDPSCTTLATAYAAKEDAVAVSTFTTDTNGHLTILGLMEATYYLKETKAPTGYTLNSTVYTIKIDNLKYFETGDHKDKLKSYDITVSDAAGSKTVNHNYDGTIASCTVALTGSSGTTASATGTEGNGFEIKNTRLSALPSTGGMGTYLFTIVGVAVMTVVVLMFLRRRE